MADVMEEQVNDGRCDLLVPTLACVLNQLCVRNDIQPVDPRYYTKFHAMHVPAVSIKDYLFRISNYAKCSADCYVLALVYIDRVIRGNANFAVNSLNAHRLVIVAMMVAAKYHDDHYFNNDYYAVIGGVTNEEINTLEVEFLFMINFNLFVAVESFRQYERELLNHGQQCWQCASTLLATLPQGTIQTQE